MGNKIIEKLVGVFTDLFNIKIYTTPKLQLCKVKVTNVHKERNYLHD